MITVLARSDESTPSPHRVKTVLGEWIENLRQRRKEIEALEAAYDAVKKSHNDLVQIRQSAHQI